MAKAAKRKKAAEPGNKVIKPEQEEPKAVAQYDADDYGAGFEDFTRDDVAIPFLRILQKGSPQVDEDNSEHVEGAKAGMLFNSVTGRMYDKDSGALVIPVHRIHQYIEWKPRDEGGGFVAAYDPDDPVVIEAKRGGTFGDLETPEGNELKETFNVFTIIVGEGDEEGEYESAIMPFTSTQIKKYKKWMTTCRSIILKDSEGRRRPAPMFSHVFRVRTKFEENASGTWYGYVISFANGIKAEDSRLSQDDFLYQAAKGFRDLVTSGVAKADYASAAQDAELDDDDLDDDDNGDEVF